MGFNPFKAVEKAAKGVVKGIGHATKELKDEIVDKPIKAISQGVDHAANQLKEEIEKELKEKYNHSIHHVYDKSVDLIEKKYDPFIGELMQNKDWKIIVVGTVLKELKPMIIGKLRNEFREKILKELEK
jgi:hypothetical protein